MQKPYHDGDIVQAHESHLLHRDAGAVGALVPTQAGLHHLRIDNNPMAKLDLGCSCSMHTAETAKCVGGVMCMFGLLGLYMHCGSAIVLMRVCTQHASSIGNTQR